MAYNQQQITASLDSLIQRGVDHLPHAYLFIGASIVTKQTAERFAEQILGKPFANNVDAVYFDVADSGSSIAVLREVIHISSLRPVQAARKVVLLEHVEQASVQMMNALLKTLEEPPAHTLYILLSSRPLLATVMSRCQVFNLSTNAAVAHIEDLPEDVRALLITLQERQHAGIAERMTLVSKLADVEDAPLQQLISHWLQIQKAELAKNPQNFPAVRCTMETLQSLQGNFNKKMVLQNFVLNSLA